MTENHCEECGDELTEDDDLDWDERLCNSCIKRCNLDEPVFADPGGNSALRAETKNNPRNLPCPTCKEPNRLTPADKARGYCCDRCADLAEGNIPAY